MAFTEKKTCVIEPLIYPGFMAESLSDITGGARWVTADEALEKLFVDGDKRPTRQWFKNKMRELNVSSRRLGHRTLLFDLGEAAVALGLCPHEVTGIKPHEAFSGTSPDAFRPLCGDFLTTGDAAIRIAFEPWQTEADALACFAVLYQVHHPVCVDGEDFWLLSGLVRSSAETMRAFDKMTQREKTQPN